MTPRLSRRAACPVTAGACVLAALLALICPTTTEASVAAVWDVGEADGATLRDSWGKGNWTARVATAEGQAAAAAPASNGWHQVALTYDGKALRLVVDGRLAKETVCTGALVSQPDTPLVIGAYSTHHGPLQGGIARVEVHDEALTEEVLRAAWETWQVEHPEKDDFTFAAAADLHMTDTKSVEIVNDAVDMINADGRVAFSLWLGDLTRASTPDETVLARLALDRLKRPRHTLRGNHDLAEGVYEKEFGPLNTVFTYGGWKFLLVDSNPGDKTPLSDGQRQWIRDQLADTDPKTPLVLCTHHPLMPHTKSYLLAGADEVIALFEGHNLKAALAGHYHGNQEETVDGVLYTTTACLTLTRNNFDGTQPRGYRLFHCRDREISTEFVEVPTEPR